MGNHYLNEPREPTLQEQRVAAPDTPRHRSRKDRKRWCGGHVGREHVPVIRLSKWGVHRRSRGVATCGWRERHHWEFTLTERYWVGTGDWWWSCDHERGCERCGKILQPFGIGRECPDYVERET